VLECTSYIAPPTLVTLVSSRREFSFILSPPPSLVKEKVHFRLLLRGKEGRPLSRLFVEEAKVGWLIIRKRRKFPSLPPIGETSKFSSFAFFPNGDFRARRRERRAPFDASFPSSTDVWVSIFMARSLSPLSLDREDAVKRSFLFSPGAFGKGKRGREGGKPSFPCEWSLRTRAKCHRQRQTTVELFPPHTSESVGRPLSVPPHSCMHLLLMHLRHQHLRL